jgi:hypothetical protein
VNPARAWIRRAAVTVLTVAAALGVGTGLAPSSGASPAPVAPVPLATSIQSSAGTWATVPMGRLGQPLNTFWQLFFRPAGTTSWSNEVQATATATNGGLVLAASAGPPFIAGVRPADLLRFSPLIATADGARSWSGGVVPQGLAATPDSLATALGGPTLALVDGGLKAQVLTSTGSLSNWRTLTTARRLAAGAAGQACGLVDLVAVAAEPGQAVVGASCRHPGVVGIFTVGAGSLHLRPVHLPAPLHGGKVEVLGLETTPSGLSALLAVAGRAGTRRVVARTGAGGGWVVSSGEAVPKGLRLASFGPTAGTGYFALLAGSSGPARLLVQDDDGPSGAWARLPAPPPGTDTVAFDTAAAGSMDALAVDDSTVTIWTLGPPAGHWTSGQVLHVKIKFGSSS